MPTRTQLYYILDQLTHEPLAIDDLTVWSRAFEDSDRRIVNQTAVGEARVSTVFLGIDHNWLGVGPPLLFETMIFGGPHSEWQCRYSTWADAAIGHDQVVADLQAGRDP